MTVTACDASYTILPYSYRCYASFLLACEQITSHESPMSSPGTVLYASQPYIPAKTRKATAPINVTVSGQLASMNHETSSRECVREGRTYCA